MCTGVFSVFDFEFAIAVEKLGLILLLFERE